MIGLFCFVLAVLASPFKSKLRLEAENAVLRHQLIILRRGLHGRVGLTNHDRWFFIQLYRWFPSILTLASGFFFWCTIRLSTGDFHDDLEAHNQPKAEIWVNLDRIVQMTTITVQDGYPSTEIIMANGASMYVHEKPVDIANWTKGR